MNIPTTSIPEYLASPCGINCGLCRAYLRERNKCAGCNVDSFQKPGHCITCKIKNCAERPGSSRFCFECSKYPCALLRHLDTRYRTRYFMSPVKNLDEIHERGLRMFMETESRRWSCPQCGNPVCMHTGKCSRCGASLF